MFNIFATIFQSENKKNQKEKLIAENNSRPCPECSEELERMDRCLNCGVDLTYYNGFCYAIDEAESMS